MKNDYQVTFRGFDDGDSLAQQLAEDVAALLRQGIERRRQASLVVPGGSTPVLFFQALSRRELAWDSVFIALSDERWVDHGHAESNERLVRAHLLHNNAATGRFISLKTSHASAQRAEKDCATRISFLPRPFDAVILGMGEDGHTASLFAQSPNLAELTDLRSSKMCAATTPQGILHQRMTLTLPLLLDAGAIILLITGKAKLKVFERALSQGLMAAMPIRYVLAHARSPVTVYWAP